MSSQANQHSFLDEVVKPKPTFLNTFRTANFFSQITYWYANPFIDAIKNNKGQIKEEMLLDMEMKEGETERVTLFFQKQI